MDHESPTDSLFKRLVLRDVKVVKWQGEILTEENLSKVQLSPANGGYILQEDRVACRFDQHLKLLSEDGEAIAIIEVGVIVDFHLADGDDFSADDENALGQLLVPAAWGVAYPYVRESVQSMTLKLGLDPIILGVLNIDDRSPQDIHIRGVAEFREPS